MTGTPPAPPSDPFFSQQWTLAQPSDIDMDVPEAWLLRSTYQAAPLVVAVIDTGLDFTPPNPDLASLWTNPGEVMNGLDDDGNGFIDDLSGYDFVNDDGHPDDEHGHGTAVSGILGAVTEPHAVRRLLAALGLAPEPPPGRPALTPRDRAHRRRRRPRPFADPAGRVPALISPSSRRLAGPPPRATLRPP